MFASAISLFWSIPDARGATGPAPRRRPSPIFIGDAVQPWGRETLLLEILRRDAEDQPFE
ncbi:hypothetical protein [Roseobacter sinensis]|uniref:Uncharacterized protein n=1 Tax=Roseobacter sinensis TaxID=2931391 RepID=A0ABT3BDH5_9RHOB|nr:hypothetical protein [Roseobacter sp. WL0113]MCV3271627.1 hypothetical protein [Roseobacter sp. WL0113]